MPTMNRVQSFDTQHIHTRMYDVWCTHHISAALLQPSRSNGLVSNLPYHSTFQMEEPNQNE